jgi:hypothetical protein
MYSDGGTTIPVELFCFHGSKLRKVILPPYHAGRYRGFPDNHATSKKKHAVKGKLTFLIIRSRTGKRRRFSISKNFILCMALLSLVLLGSGIVGALKYKENLDLKKKCLRLEVEKNQLEAVSRTVQELEKEEESVRKLLGLQAGNASEKDGSRQPSPAGAD